MVDKKFSPSETEQILSVFLNVQSILPHAGNNRKMKSRQSKVVPKKYARGWGEGGLEYKGHLSEDCSGVGTVATVAALAATLVRP